MTATCNHFPDSYGGGRWALTWRLTRCTGTGVAVRADGDMAEPVDTRRRQGRQRAELPEMVRHNESAASCPVGRLG